MPRTLSGVALAVHPVRRRRCSRSRPASSRRRARSPRSGWLERLRGRGWALVPIGSIVGVIFAIRYVSDTATGLTWLALIAVPLLAAVGAGLGDARVARRSLALLAIPLFVLAWLDKTTLVGEASRRAAVGAQLRHARRAAGRGHAAGLAEGRDRR